MIQGVVAELSVVGQLQSQIYVHTGHYAVKNAIGEPTPQSLIDEWQAAAQVAWLACHHPSYRMTSLRVRQVVRRGEQGEFAEEQSPPTAVGSRSSAGVLALAPWLTVTVTERSAFTGRRARGRFYVSGGAEADLTADVWESTYLALITSYCNALNAAFGPLGTSGDWKRVVFSPTAYRAGAAAIAATRDVTSYVVRPQLSTQRSRRPEYLQA